MCCLCGVLLCACCWLVGFVGIYQIDVVCGWRFEGSLVRRVMGSEMANSVHLLGSFRKWMIGEWEWDQSGFIAECGFQRELNCDFVHFDEMDIKRFAPHYVDIYLIGAVCSVDHSHIFGSINWQSWWPTRGARNRLVKLLYHFIDNNQSIRFVAVGRIQFVYSVFGFLCVYTRTKPKHRMCVATARTYLIMWKHNIFLIAHRATAASAADGGGYWLFIR